MMLTFHKNFLNTQTKQPSENIVILLSNIKKVLIWDFTCSTFDMSASGLYDRQNRILNSMANICLSVQIPREMRVRFALLWNVWVILMSECVGIFRIRDAPNWKASERLYTMISIHIAN